MSGRESRHVPAIAVPVECLEPCARVRVTSRPQMAQWAARAAPAPATVQQTCIPAPAADAPCSFIFILAKFTGRRRLVCLSVSAIPRAAGQQRAAAVCLSRRCTRYSRIIASFQTFRLRCLVVASQRSAHADDRFSQRTRVYLIPRDPCHFMSSGSVVRVRVRGECKCRASIMGILRV